MLVLVATLQDFFNRRPENQSEDGDEKTKGNEEETKDEEKDANGSKKSGSTLLPSISMIMAYFWIKFPK